MKRLRNATGTLPRILLFSTRLSPRLSQKKGPAPSAHPLSWILCAFLLITGLATGPVRGAELVIVIDDVGYNLNRAHRILAMPGTVTLGILPYAPHARTIARLAHEQGLEIILHQPMEPVMSRALAAKKVEPGTLKLAMTEGNFQTTFSASLARFPNVVGVNNHTGSLLTAHRLPMEWLMAGIAERGLFFLDSRTTPYTVAESTARDLRVPTIRRDIFLDHEQREAFLIQAFDDALAIARRRGHAVIIAHPHRMTLAFLEARLAELPRDVRLTSLARLIDPPTTTLDRAVLALPGSPGFPSRSLGQ